jgi:tubulin monoglycylase TTLL15
MFQVAGLTLSFLAIAIIYKFEVLYLLQEKFQDIVKDENSTSHVFFCEPTEISYIFENVNKVMVQFGSKKSSLKDLKKGNWNILWSHEYINAVPFDFSKLKKHQKVNHIPGIHHLTSKSHLAAFTDSKYVPKGFLNAVDVMETYADHHIINKNPPKRYVKKSKTNGEIQLMNVFEMNFENKDEFSGYFAQEYVENPLLIDGHKFEFSVDVLITSVNPLRIYYYDKNVELLFAQKPYNSKTENDVDSYVIGETRIVASDFPGFQKYFNQSLNNKEALNNVLRQKRINVQKVWEQVEDSIRVVVSDKEKYFMEEVVKEFFENI